MVSSRLLKFLLIICVCHLVTEFCILVLFLASLWIIQCYFYHWFFRVFKISIMSLFYLLFFNSYVPGCFFSMQFFNCILSFCDTFVRFRHQMLYFLSGKNLEFFFLSLSSFLNTWTHLCSSWINCQSFG